MTVDQLFALGNLFASIGMYSAAQTYRRRAQARIVEIARYGLTVE